MLMTEIVYLLPLLKTLTKGDKLFQILKEEIEKEFAHTYVYLTWQYIPEDCKYVENGV